MMGKTRRLIFAASLVAVFMLSLAGAAFAVTLTAYSVYPETNYQAQGLLVLAEKIEEYTKGEVVLNVELAGSLGFQGPDLLRAVRDGSVHIAEIVSTGVAGDETIFGIRSLPFMIDDWDSARDFDVMAKKYYDEAAKEWGQKILYIAPWPFAGLWTQKEINSIADMKGLKTRTFDRNGALIMTAVGATPLAMPFSECYTSLATGVIDSIITSGTTVRDGKLWEVLKYYYPIKMEITTSMININLKAFEKLTPSQQEAIMKASEEVEDYLWQKARQEEEGNLKICEEHGCKMMEVDLGIQEELKKLGEKVSREWIDKNPKAKPLYEEFWNKYN
jgi:TRAP-type C4-dicarboxylate transport system substrate-binding protein